MRDPRGIVSRKHHCRKRTPYSRPVRAMDFGSGFYTTSSQDQAKSWADEVSRTRGGEPIINIYEFDEEKATSDLNILKFESANREWLSFVISNRHGNNTMDYDVVIGPVANNTIYTTIAGFENGLYTVEETVSRLKTGTLYDRILFHTERSLRYISFIGSEDTR